MTDTLAILDRLRGLHPRTIDLSLERVTELLGRLGNPQDRLPPLVHVAGTNGKGSVCAMLRAMAEAGGKRVQVYTSPHLVRFHERIMLPGSDNRARPIPDAQLRDVLLRAEAANTGAVTFFEITTAAAFLAFAECDADLLILEVGLGGRLDATNVVQRPALSIVTRIGIDHTAFLGDTLSAIAKEKAGILKRGVRAVVARQEMEALDVIRAEARKAGAPLSTAGEEFDAIEQHGRLIFQDDDSLLDLPLPQLTGRHQIDNAGVAVCAARLLEPIIGLDETNLARGLQDVRWPARMQSLTTGRMASRMGPRFEIWLDGGHNPDAGSALASTMADLEERVPRPLYLVVGMLDRKDAAGFLRPFRGVARHVLTVTIPGEPQALAATSLAQAAALAGLSAEAAPSLDSALDMIARRSDAPARVLICGSLHFAGHVLAAEEGVIPHKN